VGQFGAPKGEVVVRVIDKVLTAILIWGIAAGSALAERKLAFVVGIDKYDNLGPQKQLERAVNDARAVSAALASVGFEVAAAENLGRAAFNAMWQQFIDKLQPDDTAAIYFSGHGVEIEGSNFLLPRDIPNITFGRQEQLKRESLSVSELLLDLRRRKPQVTLVILDACRDNPLVSAEQRSLSWGKGLARMDAPTGTFIMYSAGAGEVALDRLPADDPDKTNSVYTRKLLPLIKMPGLPLHELARQLRRDVHDLASSVSQVQQPAYYDGLIGKFCLAGCEAVASAQTPPATLPTPIKPAPNVLQPGYSCGIGPEVVLGNDRICLGAYSLLGWSPLPRAPCSGIEIQLGPSGVPYCFKPGSGRTEWFKDCAECPEMVVVPAGSFTMGSPANETHLSSIEQLPRHKVTISAPFGVGRFAVTFVEWETCIAAGGCKHKPEDGGWGRGRRPVINLLWNDAKAYASWLSKTTGKTYRLLSEAEREYATRAGTTTPYWWGTSITKDQANFDTNPALVLGAYHETVPVDSFQPNPWGLYNVHGNVFEWVEDCWHEDYDGAPEDGSAWITGECKFRVLRGGSWFNSAVSLRSHYRYRLIPPESREGNIGFRVARTLD
jgi:formylglycine-generating enzyme required for sulfatase activity